MKLTTSQLITELSQKVDASLAKIAVESYVGMQQRFLAGDWKPSELNCGELCEAISRCLYQMDTDRVAKKSVHEVREYLLDLKKGIPLSPPNSHKLPLKDRNHIAKAIELAYKFRSDRGVAHISTEHIANMIDSMLVTHLGKWILAEFLRIAWQKDIKVIAETIEQIVQLEHSLIHELDGKPLVLVKGISARHEILLLLNHASTNRLTRSEIHNQAPHQSKNNLNTTLSQMIDKREIRVGVKDEFALTSIGQKIVINEILPKLNPYK